MKDDTPLRLLIDKLDIIVENPDNEENLLRALSQYIEHLIQTDFNRLLLILYRVDVSEQKLRSTIAHNESNQLAGHIIAILLIEREIEKIKSRKLYL